MGHAFIHQRRITADKVYAYLVGSFIHHFCDLCKILRRLTCGTADQRNWSHRNTLVYRLDKLQKSTGLDLRVFEDAITFKIALMVVKYMKYMENLDY